ncbi:SDR family oxidoreductase [Glycomyces halotolerans]
MIGITGAAGGVGSRTVQYLLAAADIPPLVALVRRTDAAQATANLSVRRADYEQPDTLREAFADLSTLVFVSSDGPEETVRRHHRNIVEAATECGVDHLVYTGILDVGEDSRFYYSPVHRDTEAMIADSGIDHCLARTSIFADFFTTTWLEPALRQGALALPIGSGAMSLVGRDDVARTLATAALARTEGTVELTGPEALTGEEICRIASSVTGRSVRFEDIDEEDYRARLQEGNAPDWLVSAFTSMVRTVREGRFAAVSSGITDLTDRPPQTYAEYLRLHTGREAV